MQLSSCAAILAAVASVALTCDLSAVPTEQQALAGRLCQVEAEMRVVERVLQELLERIDVSVYPEAIDAAVPEKRKNEFIRFGKRSGGDMEKRKNEFIRFGKRKNEFIRFGRSTPDVDGEVTKRKNEFIRFG